MSVYSLSLSLSSTALGALGCCRVARHTIELQVAPPPDGPSLQMMLYEHKASYA